ncbi:MAG: DinB family protein [Gemmatimonadales bacterium]
MNRLVTAGLALCLAGSAWTAAPAAAQQAPEPMPESYREVQLDKLAIGRTLLVSMVDSMPEEFYQDRETPEQRTFAEQIIHAAWAVPALAYGTVGKDVPALPDSVAAKTSRAALLKYVNAAFEVSADLLSSQTSEQRNGMVNLLGTLEMPLWQVWDEIHQHTIWTGGQVVANFRSHGMPPPGFGFF